MRIAVLGPLEVRQDDGAPVEIPGAKERLLLAVLAADAGRVVSTDRMVEALWDGSAPPSARKSLQAHLVRLRTALEPGRPRGSTGRYVVRRGAGYALEVDRADLDALRLGELTALGRAQLASGRADEAVRLLTEAVDLWRGEPYADWPDAAFAAGERRRLGEIRASALAALLEARLDEGGHAEVVPELERLLVEEPLREDWWRLLLLALYRAGRQADALAAARRARAVLADELGADPGPALRDMESAVLAQDPALDRPDRRPAAAQPVRAAVPLPGGPARCPYLGLAAYQSSDAELFHGRKRMVDQLVGRLVDLPFLVVSGASGAGKSSVVRAGLVPALAAGAVGGSAAWRPLVLMPGRAPVDALSPLTGEDPPDVPVLLVCDQLEELWAPGTDPGERATFLDALLGLVEDGVVARCIAVVRGDHLGRLAEHAAFSDRLAGAIVLVPPLTDPELRESVRAPAATVGLQVEPELVDTVVADVLGRPGALPLLSTALVGTWERRRGSLLTLAGYLEAGGVSGALTRSAEAAYGQLDDAGRARARHLLVRLAEVGDGGLLVRRPVPLDELDLTDGGAARPVVEAFVARRLLSIDGDHVEVTHEALLTGWPRLARWLEDDAAGRAVRRHLAPAARDWAQRGRPDDELYRGSRLAAASEWATSADADLTLVERAFLEASRDRADRELNLARRRADREAAGRRRTRRLAAALAAGLVMALVATGLAVRSSSDARKASLVADAGRLATLSADTDMVDVALLLAVEARRLADRPETRRALLGAVLDSGRVARVVAVPERVQSIAVGPDGDVFLDSEEGGTSRWSPSAAGPRRLTEPPGGWWSGRGQDASGEAALLVAADVTPYSGPWIGLRSPDGAVRTLAQGAQVGGDPLAVSFTEDGAAVIAVVTRGPDDGGPQEGGADDGGGTAGRSTWHLVEFDAADGSTQDLEPSGPLQPDTSAAGTAAADTAAADIAEDGRTAVIGRLGNAPTAVLADVSRRTSTPIRLVERPAETTAFRALPSGAAQLWSDGGVTLYGPDGRLRQDLEAGPGRVTDVVVSPDGSWAATVGQAGVVVLWDVDPTSGTWRSRDELVGHAGDVIDAEADPGGDRLVTAGEDGRVVVWDARPEGGFGSPVPGLAGRVLTSPPQVVDAGRLVVAATVPSRSARSPLPVAATFFNPTTGQVFGEVPVHVDASDAWTRPSVSVSPDRRMVAVATDSVVTVLDARSRRTLGRYPAPPVRTADGEEGPGIVGSSAWAPDSSTLFVGRESDEGPVLTEVDPRTGTETGSTALTVYPTALVSDGDRGALVAVDAWEGLVLVLDATTLDILRVVTVGRRFTSPPHVSLSPDGGRIAVSGDSGLVVIDTTTWDHVSAPPPLTVGVTQAEWFADGRTLAVVGQDGGVALYDVEQGQVRDLPLPTRVAGTADAVHLVPSIDDDLVVLSGSQPGRRFPLDPDEWTARACAAAGRSLTEEEWARYLPDRDHRPTCEGAG